MRVALTGGIACGKSLVSRYLNELGIETIDADDIVHELIPAEERRRLAKIVFNDPKARKALEQRIHPLVRERIEAFLSTSTSKAEVGVESWSWRKEAGKFHSPTRYSNSNSSLRLAVIPLLFETHWDAEYDIICCVRSETETQVRRMMTTRGYTREEAEARLAAQMPVAEKAAKSQYVIENDGSPDELKRETEKFARWLKSLMCSQTR